MAVILHDNVEGKSVGDTYEGPNEKFLVENGYARYKTKRKVNIDKISGVEYEHADVEAEGFTPTPTETSSVVVSPETTIQATPPAAPQEQGPAAGTEVTKPVPAPETLL